MIEFYLAGLAWIDSLFQPLFFLLSFQVGSDSFDVAAIQSALGGVGTVMSWVGFLHNSDLFPVYFVVTLDIFILSFLVSIVMRFLRWIIDIIPFV